MASAKTLAGMRKHFAQVLRAWGGKSALHIKITETIDEMGNVIDSSQDSGTTIYGIISPASYKETYYAPGSIQSGDLTAFFWYADTDTDVVVSRQITQNTSRHDHIIYEGMEYYVAQLGEIAYDVKTTSIDWEPVFARYKLSKVNEE